MASSGTIKESIRTGYAIQIAWTVDSQSVANNTSTVTAKVQLVSTGSSYTINSSASKSGSLTINGSKYTFNFSAALSGNQTKTLFQKTVTVAHNTNGTKTCSFSCVAGINVTLSGTYYGDVTASGSGVFNTIARASTIASVTSSVAINGTNTCAVTITRASSSFTHSVKFSLGSAVSYTATGVGTSTSYAIPLSWLNNIPNATSATATVTVTTYSGSTKIGSAVSKNFTLTVPSSVVPTISSISLSEAVSGLNAQFSAYVQNKSKLAVTVNAAGVYSSTIKSYKTTINGVNYSAKTFTSGVLSKSGSISITSTVTDSRGRTASKTSTITVVAYSAPKITAFSGFRALSTGVENYDGTFLKAVVNFAISSVNNKNSKTYKIEYKLKTATSWTEMTSGSVYTLNTSVLSEEGILNINNSYDVKLTIKDYFSTATALIDIPTAFTLLDFNASGRAAAFGKVSEMSEGVEFGVPTHFTYGETPEGAVDIPTGTDCNDLMKEGYYSFSTSILASMTNIPISSGASGCVFVHRVGDSGQLMQIAVRCSDTYTEIWQRFYYGTGWKNWRKISQGKKILWSGGMYMTASHTATLSELVSEQPNGIVLVFSRYSSSTVQNYHYNHFFVHKEFVASHAGAGSQFFMTTDGTFGVIASKYLYIHDDKITGSDSNNKSGTANGITYNNAGFVLRYVIGV